VEKLVIEHGDKPHRRIDTVQRSLPLVETIGKETGKGNGGEREQMRVGQKEPSLLTLLERPLVGAQRS